jgi:circadian clock protein KaiC
MAKHDDSKFASTNVRGLDEVTQGGFAKGRMFLLEGTPGTGKTTIGVQFLLADAKAGERGLYITLSETAEELRAGAASHGWTLDESVEIFELVPPEKLLDESHQQSLLYSSDLELAETTRRIFDAVETIKPDRVVLDSLSELRALAQSLLRFRREVLALKQFFARQKATVLLLDDLTTDLHDKTVHSVAHGVVQLQERTPTWGTDRRRLKVSKYRGHRYRGGYHDFTIQTGGVTVFPRLVSAEKQTAFARERLTSKSAELNALLGGGLERGTSVMVLGPAGTGKSLLAATFIESAIRRGERAAMFVFDEELGMLCARAKNIGIDLEDSVKRGLLTMEQVDAAELTPGEFSERVRKATEDLGAKTVVIDSLNGYQIAMPDEQALVLQIHELIQFLNRQGVTTFLNVAQHGVIGDMKTPIDVTYLADTVILLRYFEAQGRIRRAISVVKKRAGAHEDTIREYWIGPGGLTLGNPLNEFHGILRGVPVFTGGNAPLMQD